MGDHYQVMARRWRPRRFRELVGQDPIVRTLENAIRLNRVAHAFLFIGPRGTGKTSMARLLAMALNAPKQCTIDADPDGEPCCSIFEGHCMDVIEIDGASNNSVEQIRNLREECQYTPTSCRFKIYIIDEIHMLSQSAFNALLKTLEEPPPHVKFIFATTEAYKIPQTIVSRCQRFEFRPIPEAIIIQKLKQIASEEGIQVEPLALQAIARLADGGMRDAQSIFDQIASFGGNRIDERDVVDVYGLISAEELATIMDCVESGDYGKIVRLTEKLKHCNFREILSHMEKQLRHKLPTLRENHEIAKTLKFLDIIVSGEDAIRNDNAPEVAFQLVLFRSIEALQHHSIDRIISLLRTMQGNEIAHNENPTHGISGPGKDDSYNYYPESEERQFPDSLEASIPEEHRKKKTEKKVKATEKTHSHAELQDTASFDQLSNDAREKLKNLFQIEE
ncbi:MAG: DNA polymerase III subunit gamma/tau [Puniceicoccales bacterium]|jgi:DNA polymerase-3 subunit gamma/tau|nr:DNA polymerase III subunit gamma/tau [Puniceicoccales bacterium]